MTERGGEQACPMCAQTAVAARHRVAEMMFGTRESFEYAQCATCGGLYLLTIPADMGKHYPPDYYSFRVDSRAHYPWWMRVLKHARAKYEMGIPTVLGRLVARRMGPSWPYFQWFKEAGVAFGSRILDVGCGRGDYLLRFSSDGFKNLTGVDPYIDADIHYERGLTIYKREIAAMQGAFDCIFSKDSLEHMTDPVAGLREMFRLTKPGGVALVALPVMGGAVWREYGTDWFQIDAPRHMTVPSKKSMEMMAQRVGFTVERELFDSTDDQFNISEAYRRGIPLKELWQGKEVLMAEERALNVEKARAANAAGEGDHACFVLRKA